jgi:hypothetical protein
VASEHGAAAIRGGVLQLGRTRGPELIALSLASLLLALLLMGLS